MAFGFVNSQTQGFKFVKCSYRYSKIYHFIYRQLYQQLIYDIDIAEAVEIMVIGVQVDSYLFDKGCRVGKFVI